MIGILPTLHPEELRLAAISDAARYQALNNGLRRLRQEPFRIRIDGADPLELAADDVGLEGANTSFQLHLRVDPDRFTDHFNAAQLATAPALAVAGNSPTFLGHRLWEETRVALFKQAVDDRDATGRSSRRVSRVAFGTGWTTAGALELLEESVRLHEPILPMVGPEHPLDQLEGGGVPALDELRLHQSTVWRWNRAIYDPAEGGHVRIERAPCPPGPRSPTCAPTPPSPSGSPWPWPPTPTPGSAGSPSNRPTTTSTGPPSWASGPSWPGRWGPAAGW
jgi:hypothetical protein